MSTHKSNHQAESKTSNRNITLIFVGIALLVGVIALFSSGMMSGSSHSNMMGMQNHMITSEEQFLIEMIPHHQEAVDSARIIFAKTQNTGVSRLADSIINSQTAEIEQMKTWKKEWYGFSLYSAKYKNMMPDFRNYNGSDSDDRLFLQTMIAHHQMAVMMAQQVLTLNPHKEVADLANNIITTQTAEIAFMQRILNN